MRGVRVQAVVDRIVDGAYAVLLVGEEEKEITVPAANLPPGAGEGSWLHVFKDPETGAYSCPARDERDARDEEDAAGRIRDKMEQLRRRGPRSAGAPPASPPAPPPHPGGAPEDGPDPSD